MLALVNRLQVNHAWFKLVETTKHSTREGAVLRLQSFLELAKYLHRWKATQHSAAYYESECPRHSIEPSRAMAAGADSLHLLPTCIHEMALWLILVPHALPHQASISSHVQSA